MNRVQRLATNNTTSKAEPPDNQPPSWPVVRTTIISARIKTIKNTKNKAAPAAAAFRGLQ